MQNENSGSSYHQKQEDMKRLHANESGVTPDVGASAYTAAFILYCQKTLDNFRRVYGDTYAPDAGLGSRSSFSFGSEPESENNAFELEQDYSTSDKDNEDLRELSEQFEQMLKARSELEDDGLELDRDDESQPDDSQEREALKELSEQFEQMLKARSELELDGDDEAQLNSHKEEELEELFAQFEQMLNAKTDLEENEELESKQDDEAEFDNQKEEKELEELFAQFEKMLKDKAEDETEAGDNDSQPNDYKGNKVLKELLAQFEKMLDIKSDAENNEFEWEQENQTHSNGYQKKEELEEIFEQNEQDQETIHEADEPNPYGKEKDVIESYSAPHSEGLNDVEIDEALSGVGEVVILAKENLGIVEAFWEQPASERAMLLAKAQITQEQFEQVVTRTGSYLYDVKDCLEGWGDLSMLPETYEQLFLANNELSEIFEKMYGKALVEEPDTSIGLASEEEEDDWDLDDNDDWGFSTDDDDD